MDTASSTAPQSWSLWLCGCIDLDPDLDLDLSSFNSRYNFISSNLYDLQSVR
jgi:hypothetical protein